jgi:O-antigen/teichoic acid export membrane protein
MVEVLLAVPQLLVTGAFPILARAARDDHRRLAYAIQRLFETGLVGGVGVAVVLILGAPVAIDIVGGSQFTPSVGILRIQALAVAAMFVTAAWSYALLSLHRYRAILALSVSGVALNGISVAIFGSLYGAHGAAWAAMGVDVAQTVALGAVVGWSDHNLRPALGVVPRVAAAALGACALALIPGIRTIPLTLAGTAVYIGLAFALRAVPEEIIVELRRATRVLRPAR